ncbi:MAG TPA: CXXX repeat peptide modification system protein [Clostridiales bacterium]|jgi:CXXX repeat modification system protein|nr:CXXX repeat peptide modification system protein [Clostridiales bacterium]
MEIKKFIVQVNEPQKNEIEKLFERMNSLRSLSLTLSTNNELFNENSYLYEKVLEDLSSTQKKYDQWWANIIKVYNLDQDKMAYYQIDFSEGNLYLLG